MSQIAEATGARFVDGPLIDQPWYLVEAITKGLTVTSWLQHLPADDVPPENIWHHERALREHFDAVKRRYKNPGGAYEPVPDDEGTTVTFDNSDIRRQLMEA